ncbi:hypothetical protein QN277_000711 [Acacia crassicarpa]|uniref:Uncharacterized protein n=1 Tax=Acacia crassicarpa TaxID=499986 RepID=A0AAE1N6S3_9FABA|nr:hypothetical protein QN277_000711 [Acacia crassicarpa]
MASSSRTSSGSYSRSSSLLQNSNSEEDLQALTDQKKKKRMISNHAGTYRSYVFFFPSLIYVVIIFSFIFLCQQIRKFLRLQYHCRNRELVLRWMLLTPLLPLKLRCVPRS